IVLAEWIGPVGLAGSARRALVIGVTAFAISLPWWLYNVMGFGSLMPTSGAAQQEFAVSAERIGRMATAVLADALPWIYARRGGSLAWDVARLLVLLPVGWLVWRSIRDGARPADAAPDARAAAAMVERTRRFGAWLIAFALILAIWYSASSW